MQAGAPGNPGPGRVRRARLPRRRRHAAGDRVGCLAAPLPFAP
jgi:hypothetical protein